MPKIRVLKPFVFSHPPHGRQRITDETKFMPGEHDVSEEIANHHWIKSGADGRIESAEQTAVRTKIEADRAAQNKKDADAANAHALAAVARLNAAQPGAKATAEEIERELNTPIHQRDLGTDVDKPLTEVKDEDETETDAEGAPKKGTLSRTKPK